MELIIAKPTGAVPLTGIPDTFSKETRSSIELSLSNKGGFNSFDIYPSVLTEYMGEFTDEVLELGVGSGANTDALQIFKASVNNIQQINFLLSVLGLDTLIDSMEDVTDWTDSDITNTPHSLETNIVHNDTSSMRIQITKDKSNGDTITKTFASQDWSTAVNLDFWIYQTKKSTDVEITIHIGDGTNSKSISILVGDNDVWQRKIIDISSMIADGANLPNMSAITHIWFTVSKHKKDAFIYIDNLIRRGGVGTAELRIYDFGTNANPSLLGTPMTFDDGTTAKIFELNPGIYEYHIQSFIGITTANKLTIGHYYGINISNFQGGVSLNILGKNTGNLYNSGKLFYSTDNNTLTVVDNNTDMYFFIYSVVDFYLADIEFRTNCLPGESEICLYIYNKNNVEDVIDDKKYLFDLQEKKYIITPKKMLFSDIHRYFLRFIYIDDIDSSVFKVVLTSHIFYEPISING